VPNLCCRLLSLVQADLGGARVAITPDFGVAVGEIEREACNYERWEELAGKSNQIFVSRIRDEAAVVNAAPS